jgi:hypothetical protein
LDAQICALNEMFISLDGENHVRAARLISGYVTSELRAAHTGTDAQCLALPLGILLATIQCLTRELELAIIHTRILRAHES